MHHFAAGRSGPVAVVAAAQVAAEIAARIAVARVLEAAEVAAAVVERRAEVLVAAVAVATCRQCCPFTLVNERELTII